MTEEKQATDIFWDVSVGIVNFNGMDVLSDTIRAVQASNHPVREILVVDNGSTDGSLEWLYGMRGELRCIELGRNAGSAAARNALIEAAHSEYIMLLDNDVSVEPGTIGCLLEIMRKEEDAGVCHPEVLDPTDPDVYHYNGGSIHYLGALIARERPGPGAPRPPHERFDVVAGGAMLVRKRQVAEIGGFDDDYFFNWEDGDFTARMTLSGLRCLNIPGAAVHHRGKPRGTSKVFYQVRNRWFFMLKLYDVRTLVMIFPMLCLFEILQAALLLKKRAFGAYLRGSFDVIRSLPRLIKKRYEFHRIKKVRDRDWLKADAMYVPASMGRPGAMHRFAEKVFRGLSGAYWRLVCRFC